MKGVHISNEVRRSKVDFKLYRKLLLEIIQWMLFLLFLYSAVYKILDFEKFKLELSKSPIITDFSEYIAYGLPLVEVIIAVIVIVPKTSLTGLYASLSLMAMFTTYIYFIMNYSANVLCSCNGILEGASWSQHLLFNIFFTLLAGLGIFLQAKIDLKKTLGSS